MKNINLIIIISILIFVSCNSNDKRKFIISDFSTIRIDTLKPYKNKSYTGFYIKINGYVNDSIKIQRTGYYDVVLSGQLDTIINGDYYGGEDVIFIFKPHLANKGRIEIEYSL